MLVRSKGELECSCTPGGEAKGYSHSLQNMKLYIQIKNFMYMVHSKHICDSHTGNKPQNPIYPLTDEWINPVK